MDTKKSNEITIYMPSLNVGGAERIILRLIDGILRRGISVNLLLATKSGKLRQEIPQGTRIIDLDVKRNSYAVYSLVKYLKKNKPSVVLSHLHRANRIVLLAKMIANVNTRVFVVDHTTMSMAIRTYGIIERIVTLLSYKYLYPKATKMIHVSKGSARDMEKYLGLREGEVAVIYNPVVHKNNRESKKQIPHPWLQRGEPPVILAVGSLIEVKDYDTLIDAFVLVAKRIDCRLIILGDGKHRTYLEQKIELKGIKQIVHLPGYVQNVYEYLNYSSVFVLSSRYEALPTVLIEALSCGCPVVSTDCKYGPSEILEDGKYGMLVPIGDYQKLAESIFQTLINPPKREKLRLRGSEFSVEKSVDKYLNLIYQNE